MLNNQVSTLLAWQSWMELALKLANALVSHAQGKTFKDQ